MKQSREAALPGPQPLRFLYDMEGHLMEGEQKSFVPSFQLLNRKEWPRIGMSDPETNWQVFSS